MTGKMLARVAGTSRQTAGTRRKRGVSDESLAWGMNLLNSKLGGCDGLAAARRPGLRCRVRCAAHLGTLHITDTTGTVHARGSEMKVLDCCTAAEAPSTRNGHSNQGLGCPSGTPKQQGVRIGIVGVGHHQRLQHAFLGGDLNAFGLSSQRQGRQGAEFAVGSHDADDRPAAWAVGTVVVGGFGRSK
jgi:hypothetical protein